jgi:hypothetical protein
MTMRISSQLRQAARRQVEQTRQAAYGTFPKPYADIHENMLSVWVTFANFGRVHHVTGYMQKAEKLLDKISPHVVETLKKNGTPADQNRAEVYIEDIDEPRVSMAYIFFRPLKKKFDPQKSVAGLKMIAGFKPLPTRVW